MQLKQNYIPLIFNLLIFLVSLLFLIIALTDLSPSAALAPILVCSIVVALSVIAIFFDVKVIKKQLIAVSEDESEEEQSLQSKPMWVILSLTIGYYASILYFGFFISTFLFLLIVPYIYKYKNWKFIVVSCIVFMLVYWVGFSMLMNIRFPKGILF